MEFVHVELKRDSWIQPKETIHTPKDAIQFVSRMLENMDKEMLISVQLASDGTVINSSIISIGSVDRSIVYVAEIMRVAILSGGASIILLHNHPSGCVLPSQDDRKITKNIAIACNILGLSLLDHIIVGTKGMFYSFMKEEKECLSIGSDDYEKLSVAERR